MSTLTTGEQIHHVDRGDDAATNRHRHHLGEIQRRSGIGYAQSNGHNEATGHKGAQGGSEDLEERATNGDDVGQNQRPFPAQVVVEGEGEQSAQDGANQRNRENQCLVEGSEGPFASGWVDALEFFHLRFMCVSNWVTSVGERWE